MFRQAIFFLVLAYTRLTYAASCPSADELIRTNQVQSVGDQIELTSYTQVSVYKKYVYKKQGTSLVFTASQDSIAKRTEIHVDGNTHDQSFLFGIAQPDTNIPGHTAWVTNPHNGPCTIPFEQGKTPAHYLVREVTFGKKRP